jgi:GNAT superfamily N-acetyltransferase
LVLRRYRVGDEQAIVHLLNTAFSRGWGTLEHWKWKYTENPAGSPIIWLAEYNNKIVGHYGIIPIVMKIGNSYVTGSLSCDAATHPEYQGRGVFSSIVNRAYLDAAKKGMHFTYGFSNTRLGPTYKRYERMGHICFLIRMIKVLDWEPLLARVIHNRFLVSATALALRRIRRPRSRTEPLTIETVANFDQRINALWEKISRNFKIIVRRDQIYLNWRYSAVPAKKYTIHAAVKDNKILGYTVLTQEQTRIGKLGLIVDILGYEDRWNVIGHLINRAVEFFEQQDVHGISCMMSEQHPYAPFFRRAGFITYPRRDAALYAAINLPGLPIDERGIYSQALLLSQNSFLREKSRWFMMYGDGDWIL